MFIKKELKDNLCIVTVDREEALNAMNLNVLHELYDNIELSINDKNIRAIIITGSGEKAFIAGADIKLMEKLDKKGGKEFGDIVSFQLDGFKPFQAQQFSAFIMKIRLYVNPTLCIFHLRLN